MAKSSTRITHPLSGADVITLLHLLCTHPISAAGWIRLGPVLLFALGRLPLTLLERALTPYLLQDARDMPAPLFVIGHWRSGTTHLGDILSKDPRLGFVTPIAAGIPWENLTLGRVFRKQLEQQLPKSRLIDNVPVRPDSPQEDEIGLSNMLPFSFMHAYYFPADLQTELARGVFLDGCSAADKALWCRRFVYNLQKVYIHQQRKRLVIRNPSYMARIRMIRELFPGAQFLHIYRNPYRVYLSMQNFYQRLLPVLALQEWRERDVEEAILRTYTRLMDEYREQSLGLDPKTLVEIRYEDLEEQPMDQLQRIYTQLGLPHYAEVTPRFEQYLKSINRYQKNRFERAAPDLPEVRLRWAKYFEWLGYDPDIRVD